MNRNMLDYLIDVAEDHHCEAKVEDGKLMVLDCYTDASGEYHAEWITIEPTKKAMLEWLGY